MDKENFPAQLTADYYRRKNSLNSSMASENPKPVGGSSSAAATGPPPPPPPAHSSAISAPPPPPPLQRQAGAGAPPPPPHPVRPPRSRAPGVVRRFLKFGGKAIGAVGLVATIGVAWHHFESKQVDAFFTAAADDDDDDDDKKAKQSKRPKLRKRVLILPFDNLKIVELKQGPSLAEFQSVLDQNKQPTLTLEAKQLIDILHSAAANPNITALYADFGEGMRFPMGHAHAEEVRNAVRIFNESHRVHRDPNKEHNPVFAMGRNGDPKPSYAFGHGFNWNEYFLASAFGYVHLQARGNLGLFGVATSNVFLGGLLERYGVKAHVFRHGQYKNAPSVLTDKKYSKPHLENVASMTTSLNDTIRTCIENSRALRFDNVMWQSIFEYGSLTSANSSEIGLVDSTPPVDPLISMLEASRAELKKKEQTKKSKGSKSKGKEVGDDATTTITKAEKEADEAIKNMEETFGLHESFTKFPATESISIVQYGRMLKKKAAVERRRKGFNDQMHKLSELSTATSMLLSSLGIHPGKAPTKREKVAVLTVDGSIDSPSSYEIVRSLRQIKADRDVKCVVLRVNSPGGSVTSSEAILEELKLLGTRPVICSMSNAAASGGYYISMNSAKIFANPTTLTGSIGVFGIKFDASKWAKSYGIHGDYYPRGSHAAVMHPLTPLTPGTKDNIARTVLDFYDYFKSIVATGRSMSEDEVENVAQGRVWTGEQAKEVGLVDALGGLDRAISYAKTEYTKSDDVVVEHWPRRKFQLKDLPAAISAEESSVAGIVQALLSVTMGRESDAYSRSIEHILSELTDLKFAEKPHFMATMDEKTAIELIMGGE